MASNYVILRPGAEDGLYDMYGTGLLDPFVQVSEFSTSIWWLWPLPVLVTAVVFDRAALKRTRPNLTGHVSVKPMLSYAALKPVWTAPIIWQYALAQRSASYDQAAGSTSLTDALEGDTQFIDATSHRAAWSDVTAKTVWVNWRQTHRLGWRHAALLGLWLLLITPTIAYFLVGGNPGSGIQKQFTSTWGVRITAGTMIIGLAWISWQTRTWFRILRQHLNTPTNTIAITAFHRLAISASVLISGTVALNVWRTTDLNNPANQTIVSHNHILAALAALLLIAAIVLVIAAFVIFPPSLVLLPTATGAAAVGFSISGGFFGLLAAAFASAYASHQISNYAEERADRYQPDQNTNRDRTEQTNDYNTTKAVDSVEESADTAAGHLDDQTGKTFEETKGTLEEAGFEDKGTTAGGYDKFYHPDGSKVLIRPNGEIVRVGPKVRNPDPNVKGRTTRLDQHGNPGAPHNTGEIVIR